MELLLLQTYVLGMKNLLAKNSGFSLIEMTGPDAIDFAQRMFSRDMRHFAVGETKPTLFLSAEGKISSLFWMKRTQVGLELFVRSAAEGALYDLIERYHFAENFKSEKKGPIFAEWTPGTSWRKTDFFFEATRKAEWADSDQPWLLHRIYSRLPEEGSDYDSSTLVFDVGFEELCDAGKGCYIGQEVVERVRTRGGKGPRELVAFVWGGKIEADQIVCSSEGEALGSISGSVAQSDSSQWISLGFLKRGSSEKHSKFSIQGTAVVGQILDKS